MVSVYARIFDWMSSHITNFWPILSVFGVGFLCQIFGIEFTTNTGTHKVPNNREHICEQLKVLNWLKLMLAAICSKETDFGCDKVDVQIKDSPCFTSE